MKVEAEVNFVTDVRREIHYFLKNPIFIIVNLRGKHFSFSELSVIFAVCKDYSSVKVSSNSGVRFLNFRQATIFISILMAFCRIV